MVALLEAILLGIIEGITEFLPISSTGHLIVSQSLLGFQDYKDLFAVVIQAGAIGAVIWYYRRDLVARTIGLLRKDRSAINFWKILLVGTVPAGILGLLALIGLGQCIAMIPGVSRSGATIVSGLAVNLNRPTATAFSFYLSIPVLVMASLYKLIKYHGEIPNITGGYMGILVGLSVSFVTALFAISWLLRYITHHNFKPFAYYRIVAGSILALVALGHLA